jgi:hypothetical protein|nr:MAG TPA: hypothetical protein [Herelleviridae sp.]
MWRIEELISVIDTILDTPRKRRIIGGVLLSTSLFFGGLAFTVISLKGE